MGGIIGLVSCLFCSIPFFIIGYFDKDSKEPVGFWSGDKSLKEKVKDVKGYNQEMAKLYKRCGQVFVVTGVLCVLHMGVGTICIVLECTVGIYLVWRWYKRILSKYV